MATLVLVFRFYPGYIHYIKLQKQTSRFFVSRSKYCLGRLTKGRKIPLQRLRSFTGHIVSPNTGQALTADMNRMTEKGARK